MSQNFFKTSKTVKNRLDRVNKNNDYTIHWHRSWPWPRPWPWRLWPWPSTMALLTSLLSGCETYSLLSLERTDFRILGYSRLEK